MGADAVLASCAVSRGLPEMSSLSQGKMTPGTEAVGCEWEGWVPEAKGWIQRILKQAQNLGIRPSHVQSPVVPLEMKEVMKEHIPHTHFCSLCRVV